MAIVGNGDHDDGDEGGVELQVRGQRGQRRRITFGQIRIFTRSVAEILDAITLRTPASVPMRLQHRPPHFLSVLALLATVVVAADDNGQTTEKSCTAHDGDTFYDLNPLQSRYTPIHPVLRH